MTKQSFNPQVKVVAWVFLCMLFVSEMLLVAFSTRGSTIRIAIVVIDVFVLSAVMVVTIRFLRRNRRSR